MDLANLIVASAKEMEETERNNNIIEVQVIFHICYLEDIQNKVYQFSLLPKQSKVRVEFNGLYWTMLKNSNDLIVLFKTILRQICRQWLTDTKYDYIGEEDVSLKFVYKQNIVFSENVFISEEINDESLSMAHIDHSDNNSLVSLEAIYLKYIKLVLLSCA